MIEHLTKQGATNLPQNFVVTKMGILTLLQRLSDAARHAVAAPNPIDAIDGDTLTPPVVVRVRLSDVEEARALARTQDNIELWNGLNSRSVSLTDVGRCGAASLLHDLTEPCRPSLVASDSLKAAC